MSKKYMIGKIVTVGKNYIILEQGFNGYIINVCDSTQFEVMRVKKVFVYEHRDNLSDSLYGFAEEKELKLFKDLLEIHGIGVRKATELLKIGFKEFLMLIKDKNIVELAKAKICLKTAENIVLTLKEKVIGGCYEKNT